MREILRRLDVKLKGHSNKSRTIIAWTLLTALLVSNIQLNNFVSFASSNDNKYATDSNYDDEPEASWSDAIELEYDLATPAIALFSVENLATDSNPISIDVNKRFEPADPLNDTWVIKSGNKAMYEASGEFQIDITVETSRELEDTDSNYTVWNRIEWHDILEGFKFDWGADHKASISDATLAIENLILELGQEGLEEEEIASDIRMLEAIEVLNMAQEDAEEDYKEEVLNSLWSELASNWSIVLKSLNNGDLYGRTLTFGNEQAFLNFLKDATDIQFKEIDGKSAISVVVDFEKQHGGLMLQIIDLFEEYDIGEKIVLGTLALPVTSDEFEIDRVSGTDTYSGDKGFTNEAYAKVMGYLYDEDSSSYEECNYVYIPDIGKDRCEECITIEDLNGRGEESELYTVGYWEGILTGYIGGEGIDEEWTYKTIVVNVHKTDSLSSAPLYGANIGWYKSDGGLLARGITAVDGNLTLTYTDYAYVIDAIDINSTYISEISAPNGYVLGEGTYPYNTML